MKLYVFPIEFEKGSTNPTDPLLFEAVQKYFEREFGGRQLIHGNLKNWAVVSEGPDGDYVVHAAGSLRFMLDCPMFHVTPGADEEGEVVARNVRDMLLMRMASFIQDGFGRGSKVNVYVAPEAEKWWKPFLRMIKAKPANKWEVQV